MSAMKRLRGLYDKEPLIAAVRAVQEKQITSVKASKVYKAPESTIRSHTTKPGLRYGSGRSFYLIPNQEDHLVELIKSFGNIGIRLTRTILRQIVGQYIKLVTNDPRYKSKQSRFLVEHIRSCSVFVRK